MKTLMMFALIFGCVGIVRADFQRLDMDAFSSPEKADETAQIINNNFANFWATKLDISTPAASGPDRFVGDLLNPDLSDTNAFIIMENADSLWREKVDFDGIYAPGGRTVQITDLLNPDLIEENINGINGLFDELDASKVGAQ